VFYKLFVMCFVVILAASPNAMAEVRFDGSNLVVSETNSSSNDYNDTPRNSKRHKASRPSSKKIQPAEPLTLKNVRGRTHLIVWKGNRMPASVAEKLMEVERLFGPITIISSCRPGATIKNTGRPSMHRYCRAIDFNPSRGKYQAVANFLKRTWHGGVGTYSGKFNHIHIDDNRGRWHN